MLNYSIVGKNIRELREKAGISQGDLAEAAKISHRRLSALENGKIDNISLNTIVKLSELLGCGLESLTRNALSDKTSSATATNLKSIIDLSNYHYRNPFRKISTFCELFMVLPLINLHDLYNSLYKAGGRFFENEDFIAQIISNVYQNTPDSDAKSYVQTMLNLIESEPWENSPNLSASEVLAEKVKDLLRDPDFEAKYDAYNDMVEGKLTLADSLEDLFKTIKSSNI